MSGAQIDSEGAWDREYSDQGIPSSWKEDPSTVVLWMLDSLTRLGRPLSKANLVLDVGCGTGRNSIAVSERTNCLVQGFDYSSSAIEVAQHRLAELDQPQRSHVSFTQRDARSPLPADDGSVALVMDVFVYFHLLRGEDRAAYRAELHRVLRPGGLLLLSLALADDGYYATCPVQDSPPTQKIPVVLDEHAGVGNIMHTMPSLLDEMSDNFELAMAWRKIASGPMHGGNYRRVTLATIWQVRNR